jgi:hypothetical protein
MKDDQSVQKLEPERRNDEQIDGRDVGSMTAQEGPPARRRRAAGGGAGVDWAMSIPSFSSSPWMRGAPQSGLSRLMA